MHKHIGIICINLGSPASYKAEDIRIFLKQFLSDKRVVGLPKLLWWPILNGIVLRVRPKKLSGLYKSIWTKQGSPLTVISNNQVTKLNKILNENLDTQQTNFTVKFACCYGQPSIETIYQQLLAEKVTEIIVLPLYPQYAASTSGVVFHRLANCVHPCQGSCAFKCKQPKICSQYLEHIMPKIITINSYYQHPAYIQAIANSIENFWQKNPRGEKLVMSFHGLPEITKSRGDPYYNQCLISAKLIAKKLNLKPTDYIVSFQSRFGFSEWLQPYTTDTLTELAKSGVKNIDIICPGFSVDCLETLEEIAVQLKADFLQAGGNKYQYIPALNDSEESIKMLAKFIYDNTPILSK